MTRSDKKIDPIDKIATHLNTRLLTRLYLSCAATNLAFRCAATQLLLVPMTQICDVNNASCKHLSLDLAKAKDILSPDP